MSLVTYLDLRLISKSLRCMFHPIWKEAELMGSALEVAYLLPRTQVNTQVSLFFMKELTNFNSIIEKMQKRLTGWKANTLFFLWLGGPLLFKQSLHPEASYIDQRREFPYFQGLVLSVGKDLATDLRQHSVWQPNRKVSGPIRSSPIIPSLSMYSIFQEPFFPNDGKVLMIHLPQNHQS